MGKFYIQVTVQNISDREQSAIIPKLLVGAGSDYTWVPERNLAKLGIEKEKTIQFVRPNGQQISRSAGFAIIRLDEASTVDEVIFAEKGDMATLGARTLGSLDLAVDSKREQLVPANGSHSALASTDRTPS